MPLKLGEAVALPGSIRILLAESEQNLRLKDALQSALPGGSVVLAFGPEGGWTEAEVVLFREANWSVASLGKTILRAETAVIAAVAVVMAELS